METLLQLVTTDVSKLSHDLQLYSINFLVFYDVDQICGDKCLKVGKDDHKPFCEKFKWLWESPQCQSQAPRFQGESKSICQCGQNTMSIDDMNFSRSYCCILEQTCQDEGNRIVCQNGTLTSLNERCGDTCPIDKAGSAMAISTKEACNQGTIKCRKNKNIAYDINEVCNQEQDNEDSYAEKFCGSLGGLPCYNNLTKGLHKIEQCYNKGFIG